MILGKNNFQMNGVSLRRRFALKPVQLVSGPKVWLSHYWEVRVTGATLEGGYFRTFHLDWHFYNFLDKDEALMMVATATAYREQLKKTSRYNAEHWNKPQFLEIPGQLWYATFPRTPDDIGYRRGQRHTHKVKPDVTNFDFIKALTPQNFN